MKPFLIGRVVKRVRTDSGGDFFVILAEGEASKRFRADARLFACPDNVQPDLLVSFYADSNPRTSKTLPRVRQILFEPQP
jgi:hypothetical protein